LHDCDAVSVEVEKTKDRRLVKIGPTVAVKAATEEATCGQVRISFALWRNVNDGLSSKTLSGLTVTRSPLPITADL
jgi:hypothetical protein